MRLQIYRQLDGLEVARLRLLKELVEIETAHRDQLARHFQLDPGRGFEFRCAVEFQKGLFAAPGIAHHGPRITSQIRAVNDERSDGAAARSFFKLVGPAAVVGERLALEEFRVVGDGLIHEEQRDLAFQVVALVIVPLKFGSGDAVADKNNGSIDVGGFGLELVGGDVIVELFQVQWGAIRKRQGKCGSGKCLHADHGHILEVGAVFASRVKAVALELRRDVVGGEISAFLASAAAFEFVAGQILHMGANLFRVNLRGV